MKFLLVEPAVKAIAPNIALMKWARWCELNDHEYQYVRGIVIPDIELRIPLIPATDSEGRRPPIPEQGGRFLSKRSDAGFS